MTPTIGRIVHYRLSARDAEAINRRRAHARAHMDEHRANQNGVQVHVGSTVGAGGIVAMVVTAVWPNEYQGQTEATFLDDRPAVPLLSPVGLNGKALLDGTDDYWVCSAPHGEVAGSWNWPERV